MAMYHTKDRPFSTRVDHSADALPDDQKVSKNYAWTDGTTWGTNKQTDGRTNGRTGGRKNIQTDGRTNRL